MAYNLGPDCTTPSPSWRLVEATQRQVDEISKRILSLPIAEIRKLGYRPPSLPQGVPEPGKDIEISTTEITARDGAQIQLRLYKPKVTDTDLPLFFNIHGGGTWNPMEYAVRASLQHNNKSYRVGYGDARNRGSPKPTYCAKEQDFSSECRLSQVGLNPFRSGKGIH